MKTKKQYTVIGLMSGTSLDGLDLIACTLTKNSNGWRYKIQEATTVRYRVGWKQKLSTAHRLSVSDLLALDVAYGKFLGVATAKFIRERKIKVPDFIASHGHTIFHQPNRGFTYQLGHGLTLYQVSGIPVVFDFRSMDVSLGGQGAPLVPIGDRYLFGRYDCCVNLGGIANLSLEKKANRVAFDFCFANLGLNHLAAKMNLEFDKDGIEASRGSVNHSLLDKFTRVSNLWKKKRPSLGREFFEKDIQPLLDDESISLNDRLRTFCESIATEFAGALPLKKNISILVTGGGALNLFLMQCIKNKISPKAKLIVPTKQIIKFKEALIFALLGVLRVRDEINSLKSVTGARQDSSGGTMIGF